jgi:hypothetical protein
MDMRKTAKTVMFIGILLICMAYLLTACSFLSNAAQAEESLPVYVEANAYLQIYYPAEAASFPFHTGDEVEIEGTLIYHGLNEWVTSNLLPAAKWHASLYPSGKMLSLTDENLSVLLTDRSGQKEPFAIVWPVDNDTRFIIVSEQPMPQSWFEELDIGNATQVCFSLAVEVQSEPDNSSLITLRPTGEMVDHLILTEVRRCH